MIIASTRYYTIGDQIELGPVDKFEPYKDTVQKCELVANNGSKFTVSPTPKGGLDRRFDAYDYHGCKIYIRQTYESDQGTWQVIATVLKENKKSPVILTSSYDIQMRKVL